MRNFNLLVIALFVILVLVVKFPDGSSVNQRIRKAVFATFGGAGK